MAASPRPGSSAAVPIDIGFIDEDDIADYDELVLSDDIISPKRKQPQPVLPTRPPLTPLKLQPPPRAISPELANLFLTPSPLETLSPLPPATSQPIDWSSSPAINRTATMKTLAAVRASTGDIQASSLDVTKKRMLPWASQSSPMQDIVKVDRNKKATTTGSMPKRSATFKEEAAPAKKVKTIVPMQLSEEQKTVIKMVCEENKSVFFTGSAGTGKSVLLREIIANLRKKYKVSTEAVAVTASTGLAACNIGGVTVHSFGGIGLGKEDVDTLIKRVRKNKKALMRWQRTKVLVVDEISMVDGELFDKLDGIGRKLRNKPHIPFGGIQVVLTGDFFQLPPVAERGRASKFAFDAEAWSSAVKHTICLTHVFRQKDHEFADFLNRMRTASLTKADERKFLQQTSKVRFDDGIEATELFSTRHEVEGANGKRMRMLSGEEHVYTAQDSGSADPETRARLLSNCMVPERITLKKNCQVMLVKNMDESLVNGSLGKVLDFMSMDAYGVFNVQNSVVGHFTDMSDEDDDIIVPQTVTARGSVANESGEVLEKHIQQAKQIASQRRGGTSEGTLYPLVRFTNMDGTSKDLLVMPEQWKIELPNGEIQAQRTQVPLILAWALSIHKSQGQTLERVKVDLGRVFEKGQAYVALSRATTQQGLQVKNFSLDKVQIHLRVKEFYETLERLNESGKITRKQMALPTTAAKRSRAEEDDTFADEEEALMDAQYQSIF
ncbi:PIF1-like helicase-domain-containing protein [Limtongia smithiae]|uniref:PIF1-like helicase-domain-containing protein n=1 Tax=Limtongia smithiae TaxID=1125753 RepID=UPI0034CE0740